jgi:hypothetical protein
MKHPVETEGLERVKDGKYHVEVVKIEDCTFGESQDPATKISVLVRAGTTAGQENKAHIEHIGHYHKNDVREKLNQSQIALFAIRTGITFNNQVPATKEAIDAAIAAGTEITFNWAEAANRPLIVEIEAAYDDKEPDKKSKKYSRFAQAKIFSIDDPRMVDVPRDSRALELAAAGEVF